MKQNLIKYLYLHLALVIKITTHFRVVLWVLVRNSRAAGLLWGAALSQKPPGSTIRRHWAPQPGWEKGGTLPGSEGWGEEKGEKQPQTPRAGQEAAPQAPSRDPAAATEGS